MSAPVTTILLVDPDIDYLDWATRHLETDTVKILRCDVADKALQVIRKTEVHLVIADFGLQPFDGIELVRQIRNESPEVLVCMTASFSCTSQVVEATQLGIQEILKKESLPFEMKKVVELALQKVEARREAVGVKVEETEGSVPRKGKLQIIGVSDTFQEVFKVVGRAARSNAPILVYGESGTGKELIATAVHEYSPRVKNPFVAINCGAIPDSLLESELFGHEKGAFTGAIARREGRFEQCDGGTLFLDEIGDMPLPVQVKLLRVLQGGTFSRVGSNEVLKTDVRIVAATNKDLAMEVVRGNFREDLYYRLNVIELTLPPLRERVEDIPLLSQFFLQRFLRKNQLPKMKLSREALTTLQAHRWPGNVRELENTIARACTLSTGDVLFEQDIIFGRNLPADSVTDQALQTLRDQCPREEPSFKDWVLRKLEDFQKS